MPADEKWFQSKTSSGGTCAGMDCAIACVITTSLDSNDLSPGLRSSGLCRQPAQRDIQLLAHEGFGDSAIAALHRRRFALHQQVMFAQTLAGKRQRVRSIAEHAHNIDK